MTNVHLSLIKYSKLKNDYSINSRIIEKIIIHVHLKSLTNHTGSFTFYHITC